MLSTGGEGVLKEIQDPNVILDGSVITHGMVYLRSTTWLCCTLCRIWFMKHESPFEGGFESLPVFMGDIRKYIVYIGRITEGPVDCMTCLIMEQS